jgi:ATP-dependent helicase/nuclease subunit A
MTTGDPISIANRDQATAIRPELNVWVTASAGSGKTKVLTERVLTLLLTGTPPQRILCLTFTKAAAAEMSNRINNTLADWVGLDDNALHRNLLRLLQDRLATADRHQTQIFMDRARQLFAKVLDSPGGLQISTLHAFCQSLLRRFPVEASVPPHFKLMDERDTAEVLTEALEHTIAEAQDGGDAALADALRLITARVHETLFTDLMQGLVAGRAKLKRMIAAHGGLSGVIAAVRHHLGVRGAETEAEIMAAACDDSAADCAALRRAVSALAGGTKTDQERGLGIGAWLEAPALRVAALETYTTQFLTAEGGVRKILATKAVAAQAGILEALQKEAERLAELVARLRAVRTAEASAALIRIGQQVLALYEAEKQRRGAMDYDDLIQTTRRLLSQPGVADWVLFKLDGGIDHILIDEAQDTNPDQWAIVKPIRTEFFAGLGRREDVADNPRTVFAVGDRKQSIYSFQGAAPEEFERVRTEVREQVHAADQRWQDVPMNVSFRSAPAVLDAVNVVFAEGSPARIGVAMAGEDITHLAARTGSAGAVEVWPLVSPESGDAVVSWKPPVERRKGDSPQNRLAGLIAARIGGMIGGGEILESRGRPIHPGDIMVLVRRRTGFVDELVRQLKKLEIPVAGVDRMVLTAQLPIMDLMALGRFLLLPEDDLTLATVLKGPLVGLTEDELFTLAYDRGEKRLWDALMAHAGATGRFGEAQKFLADLLARTDYLTPAELYGHILVTLGGRRKLLARLGMDADDPIDEFMNLALAYQRAHPPSLQGFLHWLAAGDIEIKRDLDQGGGNAVRIITVHGAKGLQAPIVILPDTVQVPTLRDALLWTDDETPLLLWCSKAGELDPVTMELRAVAKDSQQREYHRLMYVAMTRAEDRLYVCGWQTKRPARQEETWYGLIKAALEGLPQTKVISDEVNGDRLRLSSPQTAPITSKAETQDALQTAPLPSWALKPAPPEASPPRPLAPSRAAITEPAALSPLKDDGKLRYQRGLIIHRLLQSLPDMPPAQRPRAAEAFVKRPGWDLAPAAQAAIVAETLAVLNNAAFAPLFAAGSRAEVSLTGRIGKHSIAAQMDRLAITGNEVWIVDYKTNRPPPRDAAKVDAAYVFQMATYRAALQAIYPGHNIRCVLLWTDGPFTMELDGGAMDAALGALALL